MPPALSRPMPALRVALAPYWRVPAHGLPGAARSTRAALWPPPAAALCRAAFAGGLVPFHVFERSLVIFSPLSSSLPWFIPCARPAAGPLRSVVLVRGGALTRTVCAAHLLLVTVLVSGAE